MTTIEALALLDAATPSDQPSRLNPAMTEKQALDIVRKGIGPRACESDGVTLLPIFEKRVHQVVSNRKRPSYQ